jgi:hypothetical protein
MSERNWFGHSPETIAAEYETDHVLKEWLATRGPGPYNKYDFPPDGHYWYACWQAEVDLRKADDEAR